MKNLKQTFALFQKRRESNQDEAKSETYDLTIDTSQLVQKNNYRIGCELESKFSNSKNFVYSKVFSVEIAVDCADLGIYGQFDNIKK